MNLSTIVLSQFQLQHHINDTTVFYGYHELATGLLFVCATELGIIEAIFCSATNKELERTTLHNYPHKQPFEPGALAELFSCPIIPIVLVGTPFQTDVWKAAQQLKPGTTCTYQELAAQLGAPKAHRAVANALACNRLAYIIPCHRIIRKDGSLGGYRWGIEHKLALLTDERATARSQRPERN